MLMQWRPVSISAILRRVMSMDVMVQEHRIVTVVAMADGDSGIE